MPDFNVIGVMSGTSLDGVDIAYCTFTYSNRKWSYKIICAETIDYPDEWINRLHTLDNESAFTFVQTHIDYGHFLGQLIHKFSSRNNLSPDFIASHGHTIFHQPEKKITSQIGDGAAIAACCGLPVVCDFRSMDVALRGQGAPLVPIGDKYLFSEYDLCLNLGGFSNISFEKNKKRIAFDICPVNIILNELSAICGKPFDYKGCLARKGNLNQPLLNELNNLSFYLLHPPKSLGKEWMINNFKPVLLKYQIPIEDKLNTVCEHIAFQIGNSTKHIPSGKLLVTGGGALNDFLMERIKIYSIHQVIIPDMNTIRFKEALIFAFLGVLRMIKKTNCINSVTGASKDNIGGAIYHSTI